MKSGDFFLLRTDGKALLFPKHGEKSGDMKYNHRKRVVEVHAG